MDCRSAARRAFLVTLGAEGMTASAEGLDGQRSVLSALAGFEAAGFERALQDLGNPPATAAYGLVINPCPCCGHIHGTFVGVLDLRRTEDRRTTDRARDNAAMTAIIRLTISCISDC